MGVTLHYRGQLNESSRITALVAELADIADSMGWLWTRLDDDFEIPADAQVINHPQGTQIEGHLGLQGILMTPKPNGESLCFCFDREGYLRSPIGMVQILDGSLNPDQAWISVKTQFTSPECHIWIVGLLKYLKKHYLSDLEVSDEGDYWETGDATALKEKMDFIKHKMDWLSGELTSERFSHLSGQSAEQIVSEIEDLLRNKRNSG